MGGLPQGGSPRGSSSLRSNRAREETARAVATLEGGATNGLSNSTEPTSCGSRREPLRLRVLLSLPAPPLVHVRQVLLQRHLLPAAHVHGLQPSSPGQRGLCRGRAGVQGGG